MLASKGKGRRAVAAAVKNRLHSRSHNKNFFNKAGHAPRAPEMSFAPQRASACLRTADKAVNDVLAA